MRGIAPVCASNEKRNTCLFELLGKTSVIHMVVRGEPVPNFLEWHAHTLEVRAHRSHGAWPAEVHEQARLASADNPVVGRAVPDVHNCHGYRFGHDGPLLPNLRLG